MPFRFRKSINLGKGIKLNLSKSGVSTSLGTKGFSLNLGKRGPRVTTGLPGTGISYSSTPLNINAPSTTKKKSTNWKIIASVLIGTLVLCCLCLVATQIFGGTSGMPTSTPTQISTSTTQPTETAAPTQTATEAPLPTSTIFVTETLPVNCLQEYPTFCILPGQRLSCDKLPANFTVLPPDSLGYDKDKDGLGCEQ